MKYSTSRRQDNLNLNLNVNVPIPPSKSKSKTKAKTKNQHEQIKIDFCKQLAPMSTQQQQQSVQMEQVIPNMRVPLPITQTKLTQTHCNLQQIPLILYIQGKTNPKQPSSNSNSISKSKQKQKNKSKNNQYSYSHSGRNTNPSMQINKDYNPHNIRELYLSHNKIKSVKNKLRYFMCLKNLNLSYNLLHDVDEFVNQVIGKYDIGQQKRGLCNSIQNERVNMMSSFQTFGAKQNPQNQQPNRPNRQISNNRLDIKMLYIRMNKFPYGYEDIIVKNIKSITRLQDYNFKQSKVNEQDIECMYVGVEHARNRNGSQLLDRELMFWVANRVSQFFIPAVNRLKYVLHQITLFYQCVIDLQANMQRNRTNGQQYAHYHKLLQQKYQKIVTKLCQYITNNRENTKKQYKYMPRCRQITLNQILEYEALCLGLEDLTEDNENLMDNRLYIGDDDDDGIQGRLENTRLKGDRTVQIFVQVFRLILIKFNKRSNHELLRTLQKQQKSNSQDIKQLADTFGKYYKAQHYKIYQQNPGKYLQKIPNQKIHKHPYMQYSQYNIQQKQRQRNKEKDTNVMTLDGNRSKTKNTIVRQLVTYTDTLKQQYNGIQHDDILFPHDKNIQDYCQSGMYYERMPIIILERNYLQILMEIWQDYIRQFVKIYDITYNKLTSMQQQHHHKQQQQHTKTQTNMPNPSNNINNINNINRIKNTRYLQQNYQTKDKIENKDISILRFSGIQQPDKNQKIVTQKQIPYQSNNLNKSNANKHGMQIDDSFSFEFVQQISSSKQINNSSKIIVKQQTQYIKIQQPQYSHRQQNQIPIKTHINKKQINKNHKKSQSSQFKLQQAQKYSQNRKTIPKFYSKDTRIHNPNSASKQTSSNNNNNIRTKKPSKNTSQAQTAAIDRKTYIAQKQHNLQKSLITCLQQYTSPIIQDNKYRKNTKVNQQRDMEYGENIDRYSIYEINLAYKVLMALKINKNKKKKKNRKYTKKSDKQKLKQAQRRII